MTGTVNLITPEVRARAGRLVEAGDCVSLALPLNRQGLQRAGDQRLDHLGLASRGVRRD